MPRVSTSEHIEQSDIENRIESAVDQLINTRQFCGSEREALRDFEADRGPFSGEERERVWIALGERWSMEQINAGVTNPISGEERRQINQQLGNTEDE